nr:MAG TPA: hypothetical protein [Caudoviricetes sp.]
MKFQLFSSSSLADRLKESLQFLNFVDLIVTVLSTRVNSIKQNLLIC